MGGPAMSIYREARVDVCKELNILLYGCMYVMI
jgi:hypothetical protein